MDFALGRIESWETMLAVVLKIMLCFKTSSTNAWCHMGTKNIMQQPVATTTNWSSITMEYAP